MANRYLTQFQSSFVKGLINAFPAVAFNATGSPTLLRWDQPSQTYKAAPTGGADGAKSFTRSGVGVYVLTMQDTYLRIVSMGLTLIGSGNSAAPIYQMKVASDPNNGQAFGVKVAQGLGTSNNAITLLTFSATGTAADPAATELGIFCLQFQNSTAV